MGIPDHIICLQRNLYAGKEATVRTIDWLKIEKGVYKGCIRHSAYFTYMQSSSSKMPDWMKHKLGMKVDRRHINNLRYADDTTLMAESEEELKSLLMKVKKLA